MLSGLRTIFINTELMLPPVPELRIKKSHVRELYNRLHEPGHGAPYENVDLQADAPTLSTRREKGQSICRIGGDRILIQEEHPQIDTDEFVGLAEGILTNLGAGPFFAQRCRIHCLVQPAHHQPLKLLTGVIADVYDHIGPFKRPAAEFGIRFRFPPFDPQEYQRALKEREESAQGTEGNPEGDEPAGSGNQAVPPAKSGRQKRGKGHVYKGSMSLRIETYDKDEKLLWMEAAALYQELYTLDNMKEIGDNVRETYKFLAEPALSFLQQYDKQSESEG